jgi:hypothetical protein
MDVKKLLAESKALLAKFDQKVEYQQPRRQVYFMEFLTDDFFNFPMEALTHSFTDAPCMITDNTVIHGHPSYGHCYASSFCHISEFRPSVMHSPAFRRQFEMKWKYGND